MHTSFYEKIMVIEFSPVCAIFPLAYIIIFCNSFKVTN